MRPQISGHFRRGQTGRSPGVGNEETIATLNDLIEVCKDSEYCFRAGMEHVKSGDLRQLFVGRANDCQRAVRELQIRVAELGGEPDTGGSTGGALHRGWVVVRATVSGYSDVGLLDDCARSEDEASRCYQMALDQALPEAVRDIVDRQAKDVRLSRDQLYALRDRLKSEP